MFEGEIHTVQMRTKVPGGVACSDFRLHASITPQTGALGVYVSTEDMFIQARGTYLTQKKWWKTVCMREWVNCKMPGDSVYS